MIYLMQSLMDYIRVLGEGPYFYELDRYFTYSDEDRNVVLITNLEKRPSSIEMYRIWKEKHKTTS